MERQLRVIDIFCGIGGMSKGFLDAGYQILQAIDIDERKVGIYKEIFGENIAGCQDICRMHPKEIGEADIIAAAMPLCGFSRGRRTDREDALLNSFMTELVREKRPEAIVFEFPHNIQANFIHRMYEDYMKLGYHIYFQRLAAQNYSGFPFYNVRLYVVGIRADMENGKFYFPSACFHKNEIDVQKYLFEKNVDLWYRKINGAAEHCFEEKKFYIREIHKFYESDLLRNSRIDENFICDSEGLRRCTHLELARFKGLALYDYNEYRFKGLMYRYISQASNAIVIFYLAKALREYLSGKEAFDKTSVDFAKEASGKASVDFAKEAFIAKPAKKLLMKNVPRKDVPLQRGKEPACIGNEWDKLLQEVERREGSTSAQGKALENLMLKFFSGVEGFECQPNATTETEEVDIWILNKSKDELFAKEGNLILCECKNWTRKVGRPELNVFIGKVKNRNKRCRLGFFIAWNGVTKDFNEELLRFTHDEEMIVVLTKEGIIEAIRTGDIIQYLHTAYTGALLR